jgi:hypothetical protein
MTMGFHQKKIPIVEIFKWGVCHLESFKFFGPQ